MIKSLQSIVKEKMSTLRGTAHSYKHVNRVVKIATFLAEKEKANVELVQIGALLYDIGWAVGKPHNETGAKLADKILKEMNYPRVKSEKVVKIILHHPLAFRDNLETLEEKIVWDADKIDLLGVVGIARAFHWLSNKSFETVVKTSLEEIISIYDLLNTQTAKKNSKGRHKVMMTFFVSLKKRAFFNRLGHELT